MRIKAPLVTSFPVRASPSSIALSVEPRPLPPQARGERAGDQRDSTGDNTEPRLLRRGDRARDLRPPRGGVRLPAHRHHRRAPSPWRQGVAHAGRIRLTRLLARAVRVLRRSAPEPYLVLGYRLASPSRITMSVVPGRARFWLAGRSCIRGLVGRWRLWGRSPGRVPCAWCRGRWLRRGGTCPAAVAACPSGRAGRAVAARVGR